jgi:gliding motility-associated-like protein
LPAVSGCYPFAPVFTSTSQDANTYYWNFGDLSTTADTSVLNNPTYTYNTPGAYTVSLIITDVNGCKDTAASVIKSLGPIPSFYADTLTGCRPLPVTFHDSSISDSTLVLWNWNFGDGTTASTTKDSIIHIYTVPGQYNVTMTVKDTNGCAKSITINNLIQPTFPYPAFTLDTFACAGDLLTFDASATSAVGPDYSWDFGDGTIINTTSPVVTHAYVNDSYYTVKLTVTDTNGCDSTIIYKTRILKPTANFNWSVLNAGCGTLQVAFQDSSQGFVSGWDWNFGNGANSNLQNPIYTYTQPGMYNVSLTVTNLGGCKDTVYKDSIIVVAGPVGTYSFSPTTGCNPLTVVFIANSANAQGYIWDFGDGIVVNSGDSISHTYTQQGSFNPVLVLEDTLSNGTPCLLPATNLTGTVSVTNVMNVSLSPMILYLPQDSFGIVTPAVSGGVSPYIITWSPSTNITCGSCAQVQVMGTGDTVRYVFMVKDNSGCIGYDSLLVYSNPCVEKSVIPNVFSPNGDGRNDFFFLPGICAGEDYSLEIYDRWGNLLFSSTSRNDVWDGKTTRGEPASEGTYYFVAKVKDASYKGFLQLTR